MASPYEAAIHIKGVDGFSGMFALLGGMLTKNMHSVEALNKGFKDMN